MPMSVSAPSIDQAVDALKQLLGTRANDSATVREHHSHGESYHTPAAPDIVCFPHTTDEVAAIVKISAAHRVPVIAFGAGAGLVPYAPGTAGTLVAWPIGWMLGGNLPALAVLGLIVMLFALGIWACDVTGRKLGIPDHSSMVWDEIVAFLLVLAIVPRELAWQAAAFVLFRVFDIAKPPPIRYFERRYRGGFGVMFDDIVAAAYALIALAVMKRLLF